MIANINAETAAHNIATAFCEHEIQALPKKAFVPGDIRDSGEAVKKIWQLYANVYDFVFEAATKENKLSADAE